MKTGKTLIGLAEELTRRANAKMDLVATTGSLYVEPDGRTLEVRGATAAQFPILPLAHEQMCLWAGIPQKYANACLASEPALFALNMNHWLSQSEDRRMVRILDGGARAFLSDRYRRIDNEDVAEAVLPVLMEAPDIQIVSTEVTETRLYIKALFPSVQGEVAVGDVVQAGVMITNSEVGLGSLGVMPLVHRLACTNGMVINDSGIRRYHVGRKVGDGKDVAEVFADDTKAADDHALMLQLRDVVRAASDQAAFGLLVERMRETTEGPTITKVAPAVEVLAKAVGLREGEKQSVLENLIRGGDYSRWGALNAVTALANSHDDYDRATDLEALGGSILNLSPTQWRQVAEAA